MANRLSQAKPGVLDIAAYQAAISAALYPIEIETAHSAASFEATLDARQVGRCQVVEAFANDPFRCTRKPSRDRTANDFFLVQLQRLGSTAYSHRGRESFCAPDSLVIMDCRHDIVGEQHTSARCTILRVPSARLKSVIPDVEDFCSIAFSATEGAGNMMARMMRDSWKWSPRFSEAEHQAVPDTLLNLLKAVVYGTAVDRGNDRRSYRAGQYARLVSLIRGMAHNPDVDVDVIASAMQVSRSTLFDISRSAGTSVEKLLLDARLELARSCLKGPRADRLSISEIAYACGWRDHAHFTRRFRERFGVAPSRFCQ